MSSSVDKVVVEGKTIKEKKSYKNRFSPYSLKVKDVVKEKKTIGEEEKEESQSLSLALSPYYRNGNKLSMNAFEKSDLQKTREFFSNPKLPLTTPLEEAQKEGDIEKIRLAELKTISLVNNPLYQSLMDQDPTGMLEAKCQRGDIWRKERDGYITGSRLCKALGFFGLKEMIKCYYEIYEPNVISPFADDEISQEKSKICMEWGTYHEIDAVATFIHFFAQKYNMVVQQCVLQPIVLNKDLINTIHFEFRKIKGRDWTEEEKDIWTTFLKVSPDLKGYYCNDRKRFVVEIKCPHGLRNPAPSTHVPYYYYPQTQAHILSENTNGCHFLSWSPHLVKTWFIPADNIFWIKALPLLVRFHDCGLRRQPPTHLFNEAAINSLKNYCKEKANAAKSIAHLPAIFSKERL